MPVLRFNGGAPPGRERGYILEKMGGYASHAQHGWVGSCRISHKIQLAARDLNFVGMNMGVCC